MRQLLLLRHAKSSWEDDLDDIERPLNARGRRDADAAGRWLAQHVGAPDLVLCSTAVRTRETWARVSAAGSDVLAVAPVRLVDAIYQARPDTLLDQVQAIAEAARTALLVGHAPGLPDLAERLDAAGARGIHMPAAPVLRAGTGAAGVQPYPAPHGQGRSGATAPLHWRTR